MSEIMGWAARMTIGGTAVEFVSTDIAETIDIVDDDGLRGTRTRSMERVAQGLKHYAGSIIMQPSPVDVALVLPLVLNSSTATTLTDAMQDVTVVIDTKTKLYTYVGRFTKLTISGSPGQKITLRLDFIGKSGTFGSGGSLSTAPDITNRPYMFSDASGVTINSVSYDVDKFELSVDNMIVPTYMTGQTPTDLEPTDRKVMLGIQTRYSSTEQALLALAQAGPVIASPLTGSVGFTNGSNSMSFTWAAMVAQSRTVVVPGRQHLRLPLSYELLGVGTTPTREMVTTLA